MTEPRPHHTITKDALIADASAALKLAETAPVCVLNDAGEPMMWIYKQYEAIDDFEPLR